MRGQKGLQTKIRNVLLGIQSLGERANTVELSKLWGCGHEAVRFRMHAPRSRGLIEAPRRGAGDPWRLTGKAIEWLEKNGGIEGANPVPPEMRGSRPPVA